ncbi:hypothetical protein D3C81_1694120 [compost metagenome]
MNFKHTNLLMTEHEQIIDELDKEGRQSLLQEIKQPNALANDRMDRITELARIANEQKDRADKFEADSKRLAYLIQTRAIVERGLTGKHWLTFPDGFVQLHVWPTPEDAIDEMIEAEHEH